MKRGLSFLGPQGKSPTRNMALEFFDRLPKKLTQAEETLRGHLRDAARTAANLLPPGNVVSLQEWVECRMPGEVELGTDDAGLVVLRPARNAREKEPDPALQSFLSRLPADQFLQEEEDLREAIVSACEKAPETLAQVKRLPSVLKFTKVLLPAAIKLEDWIERRIGAEVAVETDAAGQRVCRLMGSEPLPRQESRNREKDRSEEFFRMLPKDSFLPEEEKLRMAIFDFLAGWSAQELATLQHCAQNPAVAEAKRGMFASHAVNFKDWIERRIGGELILRPDPAGRGELEIHLTPAARPVVAERVALLQARKPPGIWPAPARPPPHSLHSAPPIPAPMPHMVASGGSERSERSNRQERRRDKERKEPQHRDEASKQSFFEKLPAEELLEKELELRQILLDSLDIYFQKHPAGEGPALSMIAGQTKAYQEIKSSFLKGVSLREWVDRRIGGEVATKMGSNGQVIIFPRDREGQVNADVADEVMEAADLLDGKAQDFFDNLPPDGFLSQEEVLREAILNFLEAWDDVSAPTLKLLQRNSEIRDLTKACLSGAPSNVSLKMWIDRRIGGEIATWRKDGRAREVSIGLRTDHGEEADAANSIEEAAAEASSTKKRKVEEGGDGQFGSGKGKGR